MFHPKGRVVCLCSSLGLRVAFPLDPWARKPLLAIFLMNGQFSLYLAIFIKK
jgi:hypothetical protein